MMIKKKILLAINSERLEDALQKECVDKYEFTKPVTRVGTLYNSVKAFHPDYILVADGLIKEFDDKPLLDIIFDIRTSYPDVRIIYLMSKNDDGDDRIAKLIAMGVYDICVARKIALSTIIDFFDYKKDFAYASKLINKEELLEAADEVMDMDKNSVIDRKKEIAKESEILLKKDVKVVDDTIGQKENKEGHLKINLKSDREDGTINNLMTAQLVQPQLLHTGKPVKKSEIKKSPILETARPKNMKKKSAITFDYEDEGNAKDTLANDSPSIYEVNTEKQFDLSGDSDSRVSSQRKEPLNKAKARAEESKRPELKKVKKEKDSRLSNTKDVGKRNAKLIHIITADRFMENQVAISVAYILAKQNKKVLYLDSCVYSIVDNLIDFEKGKFLKGNTPGCIELRKTNKEEQLNMMKDGLSNYDYVIIATELSDDIDKIALYADEIAIVIRQKQSIIEALNRDFYYLLKRAIIVDACYTPALMDLDKINEMLNNFCRCILKIDDSDIINYSATKERYLTVLKEPMTEDYYAQFISMIR